MQLTFPKQHLEHAAMYRHRLFIILETSGSAQESAAQLAALCQQISTLQNMLHANAPVASISKPDDTVTLLGRNQLKTDKSDQINALLGTENRLLALDATVHFDESLLAAAAGTVVAGGVFILLTPPLSTWPSQRQPQSELLRTDSSIQKNVKSEFISRICNVITNHCKHLNGTTNLYVANETKTHKHIIQANPLIDEKHTWQHEQNAIVTQLVQQLQRKSTSVSVVQADRGRGKSTLIARAILTWLDNTTTTLKHPLTIALTAHHRSATSVLSEYLQAHCPYNKKPLLPQFIPIGKALESQHTLLIVEEAGSLPLATLCKLLRQAQHLVFATTVQGYEGAGRGFAIRFARTLDALSPDWQRYCPQNPIRWAKNDPLEQFVNTALLLKTELPPLPTQPLPLNEAVTHRISAQELATNEQTLQSVYGLLIQAHYQTTPADLRHLLDEPQIQLYVQYCQQYVVAAAMVAIEGPIDNTLHEAIVRKSRRLKNQILPQLLAQSVNAVTPLSYRYARVVRIAVHPQLHRQGLGSAIMRHVQTQLETQVDAIGTSFGADNTTLNFWLKQGLTPIHYGFKANPRSGLRSVCMLNASNPTLLATQHMAQTILHDNTPVRAEQHTGVPDAVLLALSQPLPSLSSTTTQHMASDRQLLKRFAASERSAMDTLGALNRLLNNVQKQPINEHQIALCLALQEVLEGLDETTPAHRRRVEKTLKQLLNRHDLDHDDNLDSLQA